MAATSELPTSGAQSSGSSASVALDRDLLTTLVGARNCLGVRANRLRPQRAASLPTTGRPHGHLPPRAPDPNSWRTLRAAASRRRFPPAPRCATPGVDPIPGTGPYMVASATGSDPLHPEPVLPRVVARRTTGRKPRRDRLRFGLSAEQEIRAIEQGRADWIGRRRPGLAASPGSRLVSRVSSTAIPTTDTDFLQFNTNRPPFDDVRVRERSTSRRPRASSSSRRRPASRRPDLPATAARRSAATGPTARTRSSPRRAWGLDRPRISPGRNAWSRLRARGARVITVWGYTDDARSVPASVEYTASVLRSLGYRVRVRRVSHASLAHPPRARLPSNLLIPSGWTDITAYNFFAPWVSCAGPGAHGWFCVPRLDREMRRARSLEATRPRMRPASGQGSTVRSSTRLRSSR